MADEAPVTPAPEAPVIPVETPAAAPAPAQGADAPVAKVETGEAPVDAAAEEKRRQRQKENRLFRERAEWKARAELSERRLQELTPKPVEAQTGPQVADFTDIKEYEAAVRKHERESFTKETTAKTQAEQARQFETGLVSSYAEKADKGQDKYPDWDQLVGDLKPDAPWKIAIMQAENAEDVAYHLAKNRAEAIRIDSLDPVSQIREIGRLEARLLATPPKPVEVSKAPAPVKPVSGSSSVPDAMPSDKDDIKTWMKKENARVAKLMH